MGKSKTEEGKLKISFSYDQDIGFSWVLEDRADEGLSLVGGFESAWEMITDIDFLEMLCRQMGLKAVPEPILEMARLKQGNGISQLPDDVINKLKGAFGEKFLDERKKS